MSFGQEQLWLIDQMAPGNTAYNVLAPFRVRGRLDEGALERTLNEIVRRHEVLRTTFDLVDTGPVQVISETASIPFILVNLCSVPESSREAELLKRLSEVGTLPFDLKHGPLCRAHLFKLGPEHHVLLWNMHHIVSDGWSYTILTREIGSILSAFLRGESCPLPELPIQYADFSQWQRDQFTPARIEAEAAWWKRQLDGAPPFLELPTDRPFGSTPSYDGRIRILHFKPGLIEQLQSIAKAMGVTLFTTTFAAFFVLMQRYTRQFDIVVGTPTANRSRLELEPLIGYFVNTLPIRISIDAGMPFRNLVARLHSLLSGAYEHQELPFAKLVANLLPDRTTNRNPIFQVTFQCHKAFIELPQVPGLEFSHLHIDRHGAPVDLGFAMVQRDGHWRVSAEYSTEVFDAPTIDRILGHYQTLLEGIVAHPDQRLSDLSLLTSAERDQLLVDWNRTEVAYPKDRCLHELFEEQVEHAPEATAVVFEDQRMTYRELNERANQLAHHLRKLGVGAETLVGLYLERSAEYAVCTLGILKAGGAYVPLDMDYPLERLQFLLGDCGAPVVLTAQPLPKGLELRGITIVDLVAEDVLIKSCSKNNLDRLDAADNLAYVIYTSGSTGQPKGTTIPHRAVVRLVRGQDYSEFDSRQRFLLLASTSFDASTFELWGALLNGATCVIFPERLPDFESLGKAIRQHSVTCLWLTAGLFNQIIDLQPSVLETVTHVLTGGEALSVPHVKKAMDLFPTLRLTNGYGPTECTTFTTTYAIRKGETFPTGSVPIGRPLANTRCYLLDAQLQPVPVGVPAELYVGGDGLASGYLNRPELTKERFVTDPFSHDPKARLYRTGDRCRWLPDGNIEYLGRLDHQVKVRGFRIELGEIEAVLGGHPAVREAVAVAREDVPGDKRLVAYVTARDRGPLKLSELRGLLQTKLPEYMVPSAFVTLERFPLTPNGKVDRKALPPPELGQVAAERGFVAPRTSLEEALAGIWRDVLGLKQVGVHDNFFDLGGHSLLAIRVQARTESQLARKVPLAAFIQTPTIAEIAALLQDVPATIEGRQGITSASLGLRPQLLCFHFLNLARRLDKHLAPRWPVRLIESPLTEELRAWKEHHQVTISLEALAARCRNAVQQVQPRGPYYLVGYCFAGVLAFEVASQLTRLGESVAFLGLLDAYYHPGAKPVARSWITRWTYHARRVSQDGVAYLGWKARYKLRVLKLDSLPHAKNLIRAALGDAEAEAMLLQPMGFVAGMLTSYRGTSYPGNAVLFRSARTSSFTATREYSQINGWEAVIRGGVQLEEVDCGHMDILHEPYLGEVARRLERYLSQPGNAPTIKGNAVPADRRRVFNNDANDPLACSVEEQTQAGTG
jgi:aspartate racemase